MTHRQITWPMHITDMTLHYNERETLVSSNKWLWITKIPSYKTGQVEGGDFRKICPSQWFRVYSASCWARVHGACCGGMCGFVWMPRILHGMRIWLVLTMPRWGPSWLNAPHVSLQQSKWACSERTSADSPWADRCLSSLDILSFCLM